MDSLCFCCEEEINGIYFQCHLCKQRTCRTKCGSSCSMCGFYTCKKHLMKCTLKDAETCYQVICLECAEMDRMWGRFSCCYNSYACPECRKVHVKINCRKCDKPTCFRILMECNQ